MTGFKRLLLFGGFVVVGLPLLLCGVTGLAGLAVDGHVELEATEVLDAPIDSLFSLLDDHEGITEWWAVAGEAMAEETGADMPMQVELVPGSPASGVGCKVDFVVDGAVAETWEILELDPPNRAVIAVDFKVFLVTRTVELTPVEEGVQVRWSEVADISNPWMRLMSAAMGTDDVEDNFRGAMHAMNKAAME